METEYWELAYPVTGLADLPAEILSAINRFAKWPPLREVCRATRDGIPVPTPGYKFISSVYVARHWPLDCVRQYVERYRVDVNAEYRAKVTYRAESALVRNLSVLALAATHDRVDVFEEFYQPGYNYSSHMTLACSRGAHRVAKWIRDLGIPISPYHSIPDGCTNILGLKLADHQDPSESVTMNMLETGKLTNFKYMVVNGARIDRDVQCRAAELGLIDIIEWMYGLGTRFGEPVMNAAVKGGSLGLARYLYSVRCPVSIKTITRAAKWGRLDILMWLKSIGCPWNESVTAIAARGYEWQVLDWLLVNGCPVDITTLSYIHMSESSDPLPARLFKRIRGMGIVGTLDDPDVDEISDMEEFDAKVKKLKTQRAMASPISLDAESSSSESDEGLADDSGEEDDISDDDE